MTLQRSAAPGCASVWHDEKLSAVNQVVHNGLKLCMRNLPVVQPPWEPKPEHAHVPSFLSWKDDNPSTTPPLGDRLWWTLDRNYLKLSLTDQSLICLQKCQNILLRIAHFLIEERRSRSAVKVTDLSKCAQQHLTTLTRMARALVVHWPRRSQGRYNTRPSAYAQTSGKA